MKFLVLILHMCSGDMIEVGSPKQVQQLTHIMNTQDELWPQQSIYVQHNNNETWVNLDFVEYIEKIWRNDGK